MKKLTIVLLGYLLVGCVNTEQVEKVVTDKLYGPENSALTYFLNKSGLSSDKTKEYTTQVSTLLHENDANNPDLTILKTIEQCVVSSNKIDEIMNLDISPESLSEKVSLHEMLERFKSKLKC